MPDIKWWIHDASGELISSTDLFDSREEAEAWLAREWRALADEGAESVSLVDGHQIVYVMSLKEA